MHGWLLPGRAGVGGTSKHLGSCDLNPQKWVSVRVCVGETEFLAAARSKDMDSVLKPTVETGGGERHTTRRKNPFGPVKVQLKHRGKYGALAGYIR